MSEIQTHHNTGNTRKSQHQSEILGFSDTEIWEDWELSEEYPGQPEVARYFEFVDKKWDLSKDITFGAKVTEAFFDSDKDE